MRFADNHVKPVEKYSNSSPILSRFSPRGLNLDSISRIAYYSILRLALTKCS